MAERAGKFPALGGDFGLVLLFAALSLVVVLLVSPSEGERREFMLSRLPASVALAELDKVYAAGDLSVTLLARRAELLAESGDFELARASYRRLSEIPEQAVFAHEALADLAANLGDPSLAADEVARALAVNASPERLLRFVRHLRAAGREEEEFEALAASDPEDLDADASLRLLHLFAIRGDRENAERFLRTRAEFPGKERVAMRHALVELMVLQDRPDEAAVVAARWFGRDAEPEVLAMAVEQLIERGHEPTARRLAETALTARVSGAHVAIEVFATAGHRASARRLMRRWLGDRVRLDRSEQTALLAYSALLGDFDEARALSLRAPAGLLEPAFIVGTAEGLYRRFGPRGLAALSSVLTEEALAAGPLFAAELALDARRPAEAFRRLEGARALDLGPDARQRWTALAQRVTPASAARVLLAAPPRRRPRRRSVLKNGRR